jgi:release factor glutamine methyltransferase
VSDEKHARARFMGVDLLAEPGVFVVRAETELLGRAAVRCLTELRAPEAAGSELRMIDMGSGSGNLTCGVARAVPEVRVWASDLEEAPVALTAKNVVLCGIGARVTVSRGDLFAPLAGLGLERTIDLIVCNPPYIATVRLDKDRAHLLENEPRAAFDGGPYGISLQQRLIKEGAPFLRPGGWLAFEFGVGQDRQVKALFDRAKAYDRVELAANEAGEARVALGRKKADE